MNFQECVAYAKEVSDGSLEAWMDTRDFSRRKGFADLTTGDPILAPHIDFKSALLEMVENMECCDDNPSGHWNLHKYRWPELLVPELEKAAVEEFRKTGIASAMGRNEIVVGCGVSQLTSALFQNCAHSGQKILMFMPTYGLHLLFGEHVNAALAAYPSEPDGYITPQTIARGLRDCPETDVLYLVNPNNPTGQVWSKQETYEIAQLIVRQQRINPRFFAVVDEINRDILFDLPDGFTALASLVVDGQSMYDRVISLRGLSKGPGGAKIRIGVAAASRELLGKVKLDIPVWNTTLAPSEIDQLAAAAMWRNTPQSHYDRANAIYLEHRNAALEMVGGLNGELNKYFGTLDQSYLWANRPDGGYYMVIGAAFLVDYHNPHRHDQQLVRLLKEHGVGVLAGSAHGFPSQQMTFRLSLSSPGPTLAMGLGKIKQVFRGLADRTVQLPEDYDFGGMPTGLGGPS